MHKFFLAGAALLASFSSSARAQTPATTAPDAPERFPFALPWDDVSPTAMSAADLNPAPLTDAHRVKVQGAHFVDGTGRRVRFFGTNVTASAPFSRAADAGKWAARLHKFGFNCVRLHHMDAPWAHPNIFGDNRDNYAASNAQTSPESLDLLDSTVAALKKNGVYVDLNLHVARAPMGADGFPDADKLPEMGKVTAYFDPQFIALQKDYARQLLTHRNPYTGQKWADDPVVALVELNNEDSLVGEAWSGKLQALPPHYRDILSGGWNHFLRARYGTTAALRVAWNAPLDAAQTPNLLRNAQFAEGTQEWQLETQAGAEGKATVVDLQGAPVNGPTGRALRVEIARKPDEGWKLQLNQTGLDLHPNALYTLSYWLRADAPRRAGNYFALDQEPWSQLGGGRDVALTKEWQYVRSVFKVGASVPAHSRLSFILGEASDAVEIADVRLTEGALADVPASQTLEAGGMGNLDLPPAQGAAPMQARDWAEYLMSVEAAYVQTMRDTVRRECGYRGPITCSQASYGGMGGVARESASDYVDMHAYWQHPEFPHQPWDAKDWRISNTPMLDDPKGGTLRELATARIAGKPFTVSEYNHPAPSDYASETLPVILSYAALQDWDGVFLFSWNGDRDNWNPGKIRGFLDADADPNKTVFAPLMARAFLSGALAPAPMGATLSVPTGGLVELTASTQADGNFWNSIPGAWEKNGMLAGEFLNSRFALSLTRGAVPASTTLERSGPRTVPGANPAFNWGFTGGKGHLVVDSPSFKELVGHVAGAPWPLGALTIEGASSSNGWMSLVAIARDGKPLEQSASIVVAALNRAENAGMKWNADRTSVGDGWGDGPPLLETPRATLSLSTSATGAQVWRLDATGARLSQIPATLENGTLRFEISPTDRTPWVEIALAGVR